MSDEEHQFESKADAGASKTYPQQAGTIRKNGYLVIKNRPCKVQGAEADQSEEEEGAWDDEDYQPNIEESPQHADGATLDVGDGGRDKGKRSRSAASSSADVRARRADRSWVLCTPVVGGPVDITVLRSFGGHVVYNELQTQRIRDVPNFRIISRRTHSELLADWLRRMNAATLHRVQASGLGHIHACVECPIDTALVAAFVERWQPDTNTFHLPFGEMTILLSDVYYILGLPCDGNPLPQQQPQAIHQQLGDMFQGDPKILKEYYGYGRKGMRQREVCEEMLKGDFHDDNMARAWIQTALGNTLFADKSGNRFRPRDVVEVANLSGLAERYCWGAATLAYLYRQLGVSSRADTSGMAGCVSLLQCWIYEYFPSLRPCTVELRFPRIPPTAFIWNTALKDRTMPRFLHLRSLINGMTPRDVCWTPFGVGQEVIQRVPMTLYMGLISYRDIIETYAPARCLRQVGYVQGIPAAPLRPPSDWRGKDQKLYRVEWPATMLTQNWDARDCFVVANRVRISWTYPGQSTPEYLLWYRNISHPYIGSPPTEMEAAAPPRGHDRWADVIFERFQRRFALMDVVEPDEAWSLFAEIQDLHSQYIGGGHNSDPIIREFPPESRPRRQPPPP